MRQLTSKSWAYGSTTIREVEDPFGYQVTVDVPHGGKPMKVGPVHADLASAMAWVDRTERSFDSLPVTCRDCGDDITGEAVSDEGYSYHPGCAKELELG